MAERLVIPDRNPQLLLSPNLHDWIPDDDLVYFIIDAVEQLPLSLFKLNRRGSGSAQYCPRMMLGLLIYCYATGRFSSRQIEAASYRDVAVRILCGNQHPDHDTICRFRRSNRAAIEASFVQVLELAMELKLLRVGAIAVDGTKIQANASKHAAVSYQRAGEIMERLRGEVGELMQKAEDADSTPLAEGLSIPQEIARREERVRRLEAARREMEARAAQRAALEQEEYQIKLTEREERRGRGETVRGREPQPPEPAPAAKDQYNFTDPQSRIMKAGNGAHFEQAYNAQAAVDAEGSMLVLGRRVSDHANDKQELAPGVQSVVAEVGPVSQVLADAGYYSEQAVEQVESQDVQAYVAVGKGTHHKTVADLEPAGELAPLPEDAGAKEKMAHRLKSQQGKELYALRKQTVEPVFGIVKQALGFRQFTLRGLDQVALEWELVTLAYNCKRLHKLTQGNAGGVVCPAAAKKAAKNGKNGKNSDQSTRPRLETGKFEWWCRQILQKLLPFRRRLAFNAIASPCA